MIKLPQVFSAFVAAVVAIVMSSLLLTTTIASAQFHVKELPTIEASNLLECAAPPYSNQDPDPIYKITIALNVQPDNDFNIESMTVTYVAASGTAYVRSDQYDQTGLWQAHLRIPTIATSRSSASRPV
jgi:hypothetical protein